MTKKLSRVMDGKRYYRMSKTFTTQSEAEKAAKKLRTGGSHVRVVPYTPKTGKPYRYRLYKR